MKSLIKTLFRSLPMLSPVAAPAPMKRPVGCDRDCLEDTLGMSHADSAWYYERCHWP